MGLIKEVSTKAHVFIIFHPNESPVGDFRINCPVML